MSYIRSDGGETRPRACQTGQGPDSHTQSRRSGTEARRTYLLFAGPLRIMGAFERFGPCGAVGVRRSRAVGEPVVGHDSASLAAQMSRCLPRRREVSGRPQQTILFATATPHERQKRCAPTTTGRVTSPGDRVTAASSPLFVPIEGTATAAFPSCVAAVSIHPQPQSSTKRD